MANRYWVGGTGTWTTTTTNWSASSGGAGGASAPTAADSVFFDQAGTYTVTMTGALTCLDITVSAGTVTFETGTTPTLAVSGSMSLIAGTVWSSTGTTTFNSATTGRTITTNGTILSGAITFSNAAGGWSLGSAVRSSTTTTLTAGALSLNGFDLTTGAFATAGALARSVAFGTNNIVLNAASGTVLSMAVLGGFTQSGTGGFTADASVVRTYSVASTSGGLFSNAPNLSFTGSGTAIPVLTTGSWFNKLDFGTTTFTLASTALNIKSLTLSSTSTYTNLSINIMDTGTITPNGKTIAAFTVNHINSGTTTLAGALGCSTYAQIAGTFDLATFNLTCSSTVTYQGATSLLSNIGTITCTTFTVTTGGTLTLTSGTITPSTSFIVTSSTGIFNYNGGTLSAVPTFTHTAGTVSFGKAYALTATGTYTLTAGSLTLNGFDLTTGIFSSNNVNTRSINFGTNNILLTHTTAAQTVLSMSDVTGLTTTSTTGGFVSNASVTRTFTFGITAGTAARAPNLTIISGASIPTITTGSWFKNLDFTGSTCIPSTTTFYVDTLTLATGGTYTNVVPVFTRTQTWTSQFSKQLGGIGVNGSGVTLTLDNTQTYTATSQCSLVAGTIDLGGFDQTFGLFTSTNANVRSIAFGSNNIILAHTTAATTVLSMATATNFSYTGTGGFTVAANITRTLTFGTTGGTSASAPNLTFTGSGTAVVTITSGSWFNTLNFGTTAYVVPATTLNINSITLSTSGTFTGLFVATAGAGSITTNSKPISGLQINNTGGGTTTFTGAVSYATATAGTTLTAGILDLSGFDLTTGTFSSSGSVTRSIIFGTNNIILATTTAAATNLSMSTATNFSYTGSGGFVAAANIVRAFVFGTTAGSTTNAPNLTFTTGAAIHTITTGSWFNKLDFGTTSFAIATTTINLNSLTMSTTGTYTALTAQMIGTGNIISNGKQLAALTIASAGTTTLNDAAATIATGTTILTSGTLTLNGFDLTTGIFSSTGAAVRSIVFGTNNILITHTTAAQVVLSMADATNFTYTGTGGFRSNAAVTRTFTFGTTGGAPGNAPNLAITSGAAVTTFTNGSWFGILDFTGSGNTPAMGAATIGIYVDTLTLATGGTYTSLIPVFTRTQTWTSQFSKQLGGIGVGVAGVTLTLDNTQTYTATSTCMLTAGTLDLGGADQTFGLISSSNTNVRSIAFGSNNIILAHTTAATNVLNMANATNFSYTGSGGFAAAADVARTYTFGTTDGSITNSPNLTFTGTGTAIQTITTLSWFNTLNFGTTVFALPTSNLNLNSLTLSATGTFSSLTATMRGTGTITSNGNATLSVLTINNVDGTTTLGGNFSLITSANSTTNLTSGTLALADNTLTAGRFVSSNTTSRSISFGSGNILLSYFTAGNVNLSMSDVTNFTWTGTGGFTANMTASTITRRFIFGTTAGASDANSPNLSIIGGAEQVWIDSGSWFNTLNFTGSTSTVYGSTGTTSPTNTTVNLKNLTLGGGTYTNLTANITAAGTISGNSKSIAAMGIAHTGTTTISGALTVVGTTTLGLGSPTLVLNGVDLTTGTFSSSGTNARAITFGSNFIVTTSGVSMAVADNFTWTGTGGFRANANSGQTILFGNTSGASASNAINLFVYQGSQTTTLSSGSWFNKIDCTGSTGIVGTGSVTTATIINVNDLILASGANATTAYGWLQVIMTGASSTINGNGKSIYTFSITDGGTTTLQSALGLTALYTNAINTTLDLVSFTLTAAAGFTYTDGTLTMGTGIISATTFTHNGPTFTLNSGAINCSSSFTINSGSFTLGTLGTLGATVTFNQNAGTVTFLKSYSLNVAGNSTYNFTSGTLDVSGITLTVGRFSSSNINTRNIIFGSGNILLAYVSVSSNLIMSDATNFSWTGTGGFTANMTVTRRFYFGQSAGGSTANAPNLSIIAGSSEVWIDSGSWFNTLDFTGSSGIVYGSTGSTSPSGTALNLTNLILSTGTYTNLTALMKATGSISGSSNGNSLGALTIDHEGTTTLTSATSVSGTTTLAVTSTPTLNLGGFDLTTGTFSSNNVLTRTIIFGSNFIVTTAGVSMANTTNFTYTGTGGFKANAAGSQTINFGTTSNSGSANPINLFVYTGAGSTSLSTGSWFNKIDCTGSTGIVGTTSTLTATIINVNDLILSSSAIAGAYNWLQLTMYGTSSTINGNGKSIYTFAITAGGTTSLAGALTTTVLYTQAVNTTLSLVSYTLTANAGFTYTDGTLTMGTGTISTTTYTHTGPTFTLVSGTINCSTSFVINSGSFTLGSGGTLGATPQFTHNDGTFTLAKSYALTTTGAYTFVLGILDLTNGGIDSGYTLTTGIFSSSNSNVRSIAFGSGNINLTHTTSGTLVLEFSVAGNFSYTGTGGFTSNMTVARAFRFGSSSGATTTNAPNLTFTAGSFNTLIYSGSYFNTLTFVGGAGASTSVISGDTAGTATSLYVTNLTLGGGIYTNLTALMTAPGTINAFYGNSTPIGALNINHTGTTTLSSALTVNGTTTFGTTSTPTLDLSGFNLITGTFSSSSTFARTVIFGSNFIVTTSGVSIADATSFTWTGAGGFRANAAGNQTISFGSTSGGDPSNAINLFVYTGAGNTTLNTNSWFNKIDCTGGTGIVGTASTVTARPVYVNNLILSSDANATTAYGFLQANMYGTSSTIHGNGKSIYTITVPVGGTTTLQSSLGFTALYTQVANTTLDLAGFTLTASAGFIYTDGTLTTNSGTISTTTYTHNGPTFVLSTGTINCSTSFVLTTGSFTLGSGASLGATPQFTHTAGDFILGKSYALTTTGTYTFTSGTIDLAGFTLSTGIFSSSNTNSRSISFGSGNIELTTSVAGTMTLSMNVATNFTWTGTGGFTCNMTVTKSFRFGSSQGATASNAPNLSLTGGSFEALITSGSYFNIFNCTGSTCTVSAETTATATTLYLRSIILATGGSYTGLTAILNSGTGIINGNSKSIAALQINHPGTTTLETTTGALTVISTTTFGATSTPTLDLNGQNLTTGVFTSSYTTVRSVIFGSSYIYLSGTGTVLDMAIVDNFTYTGTGGFRSLNVGSQTFGFGSTSGASESNAPTLWLSAGGGGFDFFDNSWFKTLNFTGNTGTSSTAIIKVNNLILGSSGTYLLLTVNMYGTSSTINGNGRTLLTFTIPALGTTTLSSALGVTTYTQVVDTTLDLAGYTLTSTGIFDYNGGTINNFGTISCTTFTVNGPNFTLNSGSIVCSTRFTITSGSFTLGPLATGLTTAAVSQTAGDITLSKALTVTGAYTHTAGVLTLDGVDLTVTIFSASGVGVRSVLFGSGNTGNIILTTTSVGATNVSMSDMTNFSCSGPGGFRAAADISRRFRIGEGAGGSINNAPNLTITSGAGELLFYTGSWLKTLDLTGSTSTVSAETTATVVTLNLQSLILASGGAYTGLTATMRDTGTINGNSKTIAALTINHISTTTFAGALTVAGTYTQTSGDVNFGGFNLSVTGNANYTSGTLSNTGTITCASWTVNGNFNLTNGTLTPSTSFNVATGSFTYSGGTLSPVPTFTQNGSSTVTFSKAYALTATGTYNLLLGALILNGYNLTTGIFSSSNSSIRSINFGINDIILTHTTAATVVLNMGTATGFTVSGTGGFRAAADVARTYTFGTTGGTYENSPNLTFSGSGTVVPTITTVSYFNKLDFGTTAFNPGTLTLNLNALSLSTGGTFTALSVNMVGTGIIDTNGKTIAGLVVNTPTTLTLGSNITCTSYVQTAGVIVYNGYTINSTGAVTFTQGTLTNVNLTCTSFTMSTGTLVIDGGTINTPTFIVTSGTLNYNSGNLSSVTTFTHTSGDVNLGGNLTLANTSTYTFTAGTLNLGVSTLTTGIFSSTNVNTRSILFGTGAVALVHPTVAQTVLAMANVTNFSYTGTGGFRSDALVTRTYTFGTTEGSFFNAPNLSITSGAQIPTITNNSWFKVLDFTGSTCTPAASTFNVDTLTLDVGGTYTNIIPQFTRTQTWTMQYSKILGGIGFNRLFNTLTLDGTQTFTATSVCSLVTGTINLGGYDLTIGVFNSSNTNIRSVVFGDNNIILATTTAGATVLSVADATNFSYSSITGGFISNATITRTYTFGTTLNSASVFNSPSLLINSGTAIPTITTGSWFNKLDFTGSSCVPAVTTLNLNSLILASGGTFTNLSATMRTNGIITPSGKAIAAMVINHSDAGTTTLTGALTCTTQTYLGGNVDFGNFNLTSSGAAAYSSGTFSNLNTLTCTSFTITGTFILTSGTITPSSSFTLTSGSFTYSGGTLSPVPAFIHTDGTVILNKSYALSTNGTYTLTGGALNLGAFNLTTGIFSSTGAVIRSINFGTGNVILNHTVAATTVLSMANATNFTESGTGGFVSDASLTRTYTFGTTGGSVLNAPNLAINSGSAVPTFTTNSWVNTLDFTGSTCTPAVATVQVSTLILASGGTYTNLTPSFTRTQTWSMQFSKQLAGFAVNIPGGTLTLDGTQTYIATSLCNLSNGTLDLGGYDLSIGTFSSSNSNTRSIIFGSKNIILSTSTAGALNVDMATVTNFTYTGTGGFTSEANITRTFTFGTTGGSATNSPNLTFTGSGTAVQTLTTGSWFKTLDFGTTAFNPGTTSLNVNSPTLSASGTYTALTLTIVSSGTIISNGKIISALNINSITTESYKRYAWTSSGSITFPSTNAPPTVQYLVVAGGGGGGLGGGGGAGGLLAGYTAVTSTVPYSITVGAGGVSTYRAGVIYNADGNGQNSSITGSGLTSIIAIGGGAGATSYTLNGGGAVASNGTTYKGANGGSGGGSGGNSAVGTVTVAGGAGTAGQGNNGGIGYGSGGSPSGGGGGAGAAGGGALGAGGIGIQSSISGTTTYYAGGGGGGSFNVGGAVGGLGGGGTGTSGSTEAQNGTTNTGGGGGGNCGTGGSSGAGGSGVVILRYVSSYANPSSTTGAPNVSTYSLFDYPGTVTLGDALTVSGTTTLTLGGLNLNGFALTTGIFSSSGTTVRSIDFLSNYIYLTGSSLAMADVTNFTWYGTGGFSSAMSTTRTFTFGTTGGSISNAPNLSITSGASIPTFTANSWFKTLDFAGSTCAPVASAVNVDTLILATGGTYTSLVPQFTRTQTWTSQFSKQLGGIGFNLLGGTLTLDNTQTYTATSVCNLVAGTVDLGGYDLTIGTFSSSNSNTRSIIFGTNNIILSTTTAAATNLNMATATNFTISGTGGFTAAADITRTFSFGGTSSSGTATNSPNLTFTGSGTAIQTFANNSWFNTLNFGTTAFTLPTVTLNLNSLILSTGAGVYTGLTATMRGTGTITPNGKTIATLTINHTGTTTLADNLSTATTATTTLTSGTLALNDFTLTTGIFSSSNSNTRRIEFGIGYIVLVEPTVGSTLISMDSAFNFSCSGTGGFAAGSTVAHTFRFGINAGNNQYLAGGTSANAPNLRFTGTGAAVQTLQMWCNHLDFGNTTFNPGSTTLNLNSLTLATGGTYTGLLVNMVGTGTITPNGKTIATFTVDSIGTTTLAGALTTSGRTTLTLGTLNLNNFTLTADTFRSNNTNTRAISFGSGNIAITPTGSGSALELQDMTNFTWTGTGGFTTIDRATSQFYYAGTSAGGSAANAVNISISGTGGIGPGLINYGWFKNVNFNNINSTGSSGLIYVDTLTLSSAGTFTGLAPIFTRTQTWTAQFSKQLGGIGVNGAGVTLTLDNTQTYTNISLCYLIAGTLNLGGFDLTIGRFSSNNSNTRSITFGTNNIILSNNTSGAVNLDMATTVGFTYTGTGGFVAAADRARIFSFGTSGIPTGGQIFDTPGTYTWTAPAGVTSVSVVAVGAGGAGYSSGINTTAGQGGAGGGLGWKNNISVTPGQSYTVVVGQGYRCTVSDSTKANDGGPSYFIDLSTVAGLGGESGDGTSINAPAGGTYVGDGGGNGGSGAVAVHRLTQGAGGAGGYSGNGGNGGVTGVAGSGGGGGGTSQVSCASGASGSGSGGGVGIYGEGASGAAGTGIIGGGGGSAGVAGGDGVGNNTNDASTSSVMGSRSGGLYGGGGGAFSGSATLANSAAGAGGAVRIIWGPNRAFPSTNLSAEYEAAASSSGGSLLTSNAVNLTFTGSGSSVQSFTTGSTFKELNFGTTAFIVPQATIYVDTLTLSTNGNYASMVPVFTRTQTWTAQYNKVLGGIGVNKEGVTLTLEGTQSYSVNSTLIVDSGTINLNSNALSFYNVSSSGTGSRAITGGGSITYGNTWTVLYGPGFTGSNYIIYALGTTFNGGGGSYGNLVAISSNGLTINGSNSFDDIQVSASSSSVIAIQYLAVAGGGGGVLGSGGGGGGGIIYSSSELVVTSTPYAITVGAGGAGNPYLGASIASNGENSSISGTSLSVSALGGGRGGYINTNGNSGGSGGGAGYRFGAGDGLVGGTSTQTSGATYTGYGYSGGNTITGQTQPYSGGGGGGAGAIGGSVTSTAGLAGLGGNGRAFDISGTSTYYGGGGAGGAGGSTYATPITTPALGGGGVCGGGLGSTTMNGVANTGGGAAADNRPAGNEYAQYSPGTGGSGVVIIRYSNTYPGASTIGAVITNAGGYRVYTFNTSGVIIFPTSSDPYFMYNSLLLSGDGINTAQNNTFADGSTNNLTVTRVGNTTQGTFSPYGSNWSNYFDGNDSLTIPANIAFAFGTGDFTIEAWVYLTSTAGSRLITTRATGGAAGGTWSMGLSHTNMSFTEVITGEPGPSATFTSILNTWAHVAAVRNAGVTTLYLNGTQVAQASQITNFNNTSYPLYICTSPSENFITGYVSNMRIVKGTAVYTTAFTPSTTPLTAITNTSLLTCQSNRLIDNSTNNFTLTNNGNTSVQRFSPFSMGDLYSTSTIGGSGYFDGIQDYLTVPSNAGFGFGAGDFTIEFWTYYPPMSNTNGKMVIDSRPDGTNGNYWNFGTYNTGIMAFSTGTGGTIISDTVARPNQWVHYAVSRSGTSLKLFANGIQVASSTDSSTTVTSGLLIGTNAFRASATDTYWLGYISNIRIVKGTAVYTTAFTPSTTPLTAITNTALLLNYTNGGIVDYTIMNNLTTAGNARISVTQSKFGGSSLYFDGTDDYLTMPTNPSMDFGTGDFTIELWIYPTALTTSRVLVERWVSGNAGGWELYWRATGTSMAFYVGASVLLQDPNASNISLNSWAHVAVTRSGTTNRLFINGTIVATATDSTSLSSTLPLTIGRQLVPTSSTFDYGGYIDDLRITKGYARYTSNFIPPDTPLPTS